MIVSWKEIRCDECGTSIDYWQTRSNTVALESCKSKGAVTTARIHGKEHHFCDVVCKDTFLKNQKEQEK